MTTPTSGLHTSILNECVSSSTRDVIHGFIHVTGFHPHVRTDGSKLETLQVQRDEVHTHNLTLMNIHVFGRAASETL